MNRDLLAEAVELARHVGHVVVATADPEGRPHLASAGIVEGPEGDGVAVSDWFCPKTVRNVRDNKQVSLVVWNAPNDEGFQLLGVVDEMEDVAMLDGYVPEVESGQALPQVERRLRVRVQEVLRFSKGPHTDAAE